ncbi:MAG: hypothetical protein PVH88_09635 [Ignavibacteria bacterium]
MQNKKKWLPAIIIFGLVVRIILTPTFPVLEDDFYRYLWDGAVTANGINPYEHAPLRKYKMKTHQTYFISLQKNPAELLRK